MRLISLHVEKFGHLSDYTLNLTDGCNRILKENGWGKSTLAAFIRVMFYGLEGTTKRTDLKENDKKRFSPWDGGNFGGSIIFESDRGRYILSRIYDKNGKGSFSLKDAVTLLDSMDYSENIGEELFGIDSESFRKTSFIDHDGIQYAGVGSKITSKVSALSQTDDLNRFDEVESRINDYLNRNSSSRKTGTLYKMNEEMKGMERELRQTDSVKKKLEEEKIRKENLKSRGEELTEEIKTLCEKRKNLQENQKELLNLKTFAAEYGNYSQLCDETAKREQTVEEKRAAFPGEIPTVEKITELSKLAAEAEECKQKLKLYKSDRENERYDRLKRYFKDAPPTEEETKEQIEHVNEMHKLLEENERLEEEIRELRGKRNSLETDIASKEEHAKSEKEKWARLQKEAEGEKSSDGFGESDEESRNAAHERNIRKYTILTGAGIVLLVLGFAMAGIYFAVLKNMLLLGASIPVLIAGLIAVVIGMFRKKKLQKEFVIRERKLAKETENRNRQKTEQLIIAQQEYKNLQGEIERLSQNLKECSEKTDAGQKKTEENTEKIREYETGIRRFFDRFNLSYSKADAQDDLYEMKNRILEYQNLEKEKKENEGRIEEFQKKSNEADAAVNRLYKELGGKEEISIADVQSYVQRQNIALNEYNAAVKELKDSKEKMREFLNLHPGFETIQNNPEKDKEGETLKKLEKLSEIDFVKEEEKIEEEIRNREEKLRMNQKDLSECIQRLKDAGEEEDALRELADIYETKREEYDVLSKETNIMRLTGEYLKKAKERFVAGYMAPIKNSFDSYMALMQGQDSPDKEEYRIDANLNILRKEMGEYRDIICQSEGYSDMIGMCIRMSLLDVMYREEKPVVIMDDPFVNLDAAHLAGAKEFLEKVSKHYQILYFTCHEGRI